MITLFSTPKHFSGIFQIIQTNAFRSWRHLSHDIQIIILGNSKGSRAVADDIGAEFIPDIKCTNEGTPILSDLFMQAEKRAKYPIMTYVNADIILPENFLENVHLVFQKFNKFLMVGHRWDMDVDKIINFNIETDKNNFWNSVKKQSKKHACTGIDYFVFKKGQFKTLPDFAIGRWGWDNWLIWETRRYRIPVIDASSTVMTIHQNHNYSFHTIKSKEHSKSNPEAIKNQKIYSGKVMNILDATYKIINGCILIKDDPDEIIRYWQRLPSVFPEMTLLIKLFRYFKLRGLN